MDGFRYENYLALCAPWRFEGLWASIAADPCAYRGPADPAAALAALVEQFSEQELLDAGIAQRDADGQLGVHPLLAEPELPVVALHDPDTGAVIDLMTGQGCVASQRWPLFAVQHDRHTTAALAGAFPTLLLAGSLEDAIVLRSLGLAAAPIAGVTELDQQGLLLLEKTFGLACHREEELDNTEHKYSSDPTNPPDPPDASPADSTKVGPSAEPAAAAPTPPHLHFGYEPAHEASDGYGHLTIVRWSPASVSAAEPDTVTQALRYLRELREARGLDVEEVEEWRAWPECMRRIEFALARKEPTWTKDAMLESLRAQKCTLSLQPSGLTTAVTPDDLAAVIERLQESQLGDPKNDQNRRDRKEALAVYRRTVTRQVTGPIRRQAQTIADPIEQARQLMLAEFVELFMQKVPATRELVLCGEAQVPIAERAKKSVSELLALSKQVIILAKEMSPSKQTSKFQRRPPLVIDSPPFGDLDSPTGN